MASPEPWVAPFVIQLAGEYVHEILQSILRGLPCYYRRQYPVFNSYPGGLLVDAFRSTASEQAGPRWPRHTPPTSTA